MEKGLSIIIPVYNGEKHIEGCIDNIIRQYKKNIELIIINDGSKDATKKKIEKYSKYNYIRIVNKANTGVSNSRNIGINMATKEFVTFLDSDDMYTDNAIEELLEMINRKEFDLLIFGYEVIGNSERKNDTAVLKKIKNYYSNAETRKDCIIESILKNKNNIYGYVWRAIYSTTLLKNNKIEFNEELRISEDYLFLIQSVKLSRQIEVCGKEYYKYQLGESSMSTKYIPTILGDMLKANKIIKDEVITNNKKLVKYYDDNMSNTYLRFVQNAVRKGENYVKTIRNIYTEKKAHSFEKHLLRSFFRIKKINKKTYISIVLFALYMEYIYVFLFRIKEKIKE